jgi:hypothetical protein
MKRRSPSTAHANDVGRRVPPVGGVGASTGSELKRPCEGADTGRAMSPALTAALLTWLVALPAAFLALVIAYPPYLRRRVSRLQARRR